MTVDRRQCLQGMAALPFCDLGLWRSASVAKDQALIVVWLDGGMSHLDTFDCKPEAPVDIRGDIKSRRTAVDGVFFADALPRLAARMKKLTLFRSITHGEGVHDRASQYLLTGHRPSPVLRHPSLAAIQGLRSVDGAMPGFVAIPSAPVHGRQGFLPSTRGPFEIGGDPGKPDFRVANLPPRAGTAELGLLDALDRLDGPPRSASETARDSDLAQARRLSMDAASRRVFDLRAEKNEVRTAFGRHSLGQSCLLARRLIEHGTRAVLIRDTGWDHHRNIKRALGYGFPPKFISLDQSISALVDDLEARELSDRVVVLVASEFGRTPRLNPQGGRDHWPRAQAALAFGGGLKRGVAIGSTDRNGEAPATAAMSPADLHATVLTALGGDVRKVLHTATGRPIPVIERGGKPVRDALA